MKDLEVGAVKQTKISQEEPGFEELFSCGVFDMGAHQSRKER